MREIWFIGIASRILSMHCILYIIDSLSHSLTRVVARVFLREQDAMPMLQLIIERYILHLRKELSDPLLWRWLVARLKVEELVVAGARRVGIMRVSIRSAEFSMVRLERRRCD